jgi:hypothetical protein
MLTKKKYICHYEMDQILILGLFKRKKEIVPLKNLIGTYF